MATRATDPLPPLDVNLSGFTGPDAGADQPFSKNPRKLWRVSRLGSPLELEQVRTARRSGFTGGKQRGSKLLVARAGMLSELQKLLWAHVAGAPIADQRAVNAALAARVPRRSPAEAQRRSELFSPEVEEQLKQLPRGPRILLVLQGMDASGKGGVVKSVVGAMNPLGVDVAAFGRPTAAQRRQHYLERVIAQLPEPGHVGVFDRSHYEDVLVPAVSGSHSEDQVAERVETLLLFEQELARRGFVIIKVMLHLSPQEQLARLLSRLDSEHKQWKYDPSDADARAQADTYQRVYAALLEATDAAYAPWHIIPADRKWYARLAVQELLIAALADLNLRWPPADYDIEAERRRLLE
ncbi:PPK2 family polyphosphate kinase [Nesterenkonia rhizosphaerae]|uniref:Polyphosphate kinase-2-related domain-containing protein n=1 Tax=Nesterenkonia rhizosphaerae TaxID=1348272 RepID=A0ABP9G2Q4_9MICC